MLDFIHEDLLQNGRPTARKYRTSSRSSIESGHKNVSSLQSVERVSRARPSHHRAATCRTEQETLLRQVKTDILMGVFSEVFPLDWFLTDFTPVFRSRGPRTRRVEKSDRCVGFHRFADVSQQPGCPADG